MEDEPPSKIKITPYIKKTYPAQAVIGCGVRTIGSPFSVRADL